MSSNGDDFVPVLILPGWKDRARALRHLVRGLIANGWPAPFVTATEFNDPFGSNLAHAAETGLAIDRLRERTGATAVDVIAHSMGGLALRCFLERIARTDSSPTCAAPPLPVRRAVFLATPHYGTWIDGNESFRGRVSPFLPTTTRTRSSDTIQG